MKMKRLMFVLIMGMAFILSTTSLFAQDTIPSIGGVINQGVQVLQASKEYSTIWNILFWSTFAGVFISIIFQTVKGVKNSNNGSPMVFAWKYWIKDNALPKIATVLGFLIGNQYITELLSKLPAGIVTYIIVGAIGIILGWFLDWITDALKVISPKVSVAEIDPSTPPKGSPTV